MTILTHAVFGSLVGSQFDKPGAAAVAGFVSHFVLDLIPHNDYLYYHFQKSGNPYTTVFSQITFFLTLTYLILIYVFGGGLPLSSSFWGALFALLPDVVTAANATLKRNPGLVDRFQRYTHRRESIGEYLHNKLSRGEKIKGGPAGPNTLRNFEVLQSSPWGKLGWIIETVIELTLLTVSLNLLDFLRF